MRPTCALGFFAALCMVSWAALADTVKLLDGTELNGKIIRRTDVSLAMDTDGLVLEIQMGQVDSINGEKVHRPEKTEAIEPPKHPTGTRQEKDVTDIMKRMEKKISPEQIAANGRAKREVVLKPNAEKVVHISDETFFKAIDPDHPGMKPILSFARAKSYDAAWKALDDFLRKNMKPVGELREVENYREKQGGSKPGGTDSQADQICNHVIRVWHVQVVDFGKDMDWTKVKGRSSLFGFHYWGWAQPLWTAYVRTSNEKYAAGFDDLFTSWYEQRPKVSAVYPTNDIIWYELGCANRPVTFTKLYFAMRGSPSLRMETRKLILKTLLGHANQLQAQQECGYTDGNFQLFASGGLYQLGMIFPMFRDAARWRETATARLLEHAYWDFSKEGGHNERCVGYGASSMGAVRQLLLYAEDDPNPSPLLGELRARVLDMQLWFLKYVAPNGVFTGVNDSSFNAGNSLLISLAGFSGDGRFLWPVRSSRRLPEEIAPQKPEFVSVHMPDAGWTFMRDGWEPESFYLQVNWGRYGSGHTHPALLDINTYAFGEPMAIETGRFDSYDNPLEPYFRSPEAHNQVSLEGCTFDRRNHQGEEIVWRSGKQIEYFEGLHRGYEESAGIFLKRQILFVKGEYWLILDTVLNAGDKRPRAVGTPTAALNWHSPYRWKATDTGLLSSKEKGPGVQLLVLPKGNPQFQTGYEDTMEIYKSRYRACYAQPASDGARFVTLISPYREKPLSCTLEMLSADAGCIALRIVCADKTDRVLLPATKTKACSGGDMESDARFAWLRERPRAGAVIDGSRLTCGGQSVLRLNAKQEIAETP